MRKRRRIDWPIIVRDDGPTPKWISPHAPSESVVLISALSDLLKLGDRDALLKRAVELTLEVVGLVRAGVYLYDEQLDLMLGTWGTDLRGKIIDEHHAMFTLGEEGHKAFDRAIAGRAHWTVVEDCPIIDNLPSETRVVGRGWAVCTPIFVGDRPIGAMYSDAGMTGSAIDPRRQANAAILCAILGIRLDALGGSGKLAYGPSRRHPAIAAAVRMLADDPSLGGTSIAARLGVSLSRFARVFKADMGMSLVEYRNQLRLERFMSLVDVGGGNLLEAALAAGFGSYSQFHRVFHAMRGTSPREYFSGAR
jgi:AraC-like DNA-binding protein